MFQIFVYRILLPIFVQEFLFEEKDGKRIGWPVIVRGRVARPADLQTLATGLLVDLIGSENLIAHYRGANVFTTPASPSSAALLLPRYADSKGQITSTPQVPSGRATPLQAQAARRTVLVAHPPFFASFYCNTIFFAKCWGEC